MARAPKIETLNQVPLSAAELDILLDALSFVIDEAELDEGEAEETEALHDRLAEIRKGAPDDDEEDEGE